MKYFLLKSNPLYRDAPRIINWYEKIDIRNLKKGSYYKIPDRLLLDIEDNKNLTVIDVIDKPFFLISKMMMDLLSKFEPNLKYKEIILLDRTNAAVYQYYLPLLDEKDCLSEESSLNTDRSILYKAVINKNKIGDTCIFTLHNVNNRYVVIRLDFIECLLRRNARGIQIEEVDIL